MEKTYVIDFSINKIITVLESERAEEHKNIYRYYEKNIVWYASNSVYGANAQVIMIEPTKG